MSLIYVINPLLAFTEGLWVAAAAATIQDCVLPRMRGTAGALGPYSIGKMAVLTGSLRAGLMSFLGMSPSDCCCCGLRAAGLKPLRKAAAPGRAPLASKPEARGRASRTTFEPTATSDALGPW